MSDSRGELTPIPQDEPREPVITEKFPSIEELRERFGEFAKTRVGSVLGTFIRGHIERERFLIATENNPLGASAPEFRNADRVYYAYDPSSKSFARKLYAAFSREDEESDWYPYNITRSGEYQGGVTLTFPKQRDTREKNFLGRVIVSVGDDDDYAVEAVYNKQGQIVSLLIMLIK